MNYFRFFLGFGLAGISCFGTFTSLRASASNSLNPFGFFDMTTPLLKAHESAPVDLTKLAMGNPFAGKHRHNHVEPASIIGLAGVKSEHFLINVTLKVERGNADVSSLEHPLEQRPEILDAIGVDQPTHVFVGMVDGFVDEIPIQSDVGLRFIGVDDGAGGAMLANDRLQFSGLGRRHDGCPDLTTTLQQAVDDSLTDAAPAPDSLLSFALVHVAGLAADERFIRFDCAAQLAESAGRRQIPGMVLIQPAPA